MGLIYAHGKNNDKYGIVWVGVIDYLADHGLS